MHEHVGLFDELDGLAQAQVSLRAPGRRRGWAAFALRLLGGAAPAAYAERLYQRHSLEQLELMLQMFRESREFNERRAAELEAATRSGSRGRAAAVD